MKGFFALLLVACGSPQKIATVTLENHLTFALSEAVYSTGSAAMLAPDTASDPLQVTPGFEYVYGLTDSAVILRSNTKVQTKDAQTITIGLAPGGVLDKCAGLSQAEYETIGKTIFPGTVVQDYADIPCANPR